VIRKGDFSQKSLCFLSVIPAKAGIHCQHEAWIPAFAGMTLGQDARFPCWK
jgi:hypothetical protein